MPLLDEAGHERVNAAVTAAEATTSGEIVTIITDRSDGYVDVALAWASFAAMTALMVLSAWPDYWLTHYDRLTSEWGTQWTHRGILALALAVAVMKFIGVMLVQLWQPLKFALIPGIIKAARVRERAVTLFRAGTERRTTGRTGILIYLSLSEHRAEIVADAAIASKVSAEVWGEAMAAMLAHIRDGRLAEGLAAGVEKIGVVLAQHFPRAEDDINELPDRLIEV